MSKKQKQCAVILFSVLLLSQLVFLVYINLMDNINYIDNDMGMGIYHFREMIRNRTISLQGYNNTTSLEVDTSFMLAVPFYLITRNMSLSVGLSNLFIIAMYALVVWGIMTELKTGIVYRIFTLSLFFVPYAIGMLDYMNMMFLGISCYSIKAITALLGAYYIIMKKDRPVLYRCVLILYLFLLFITTMSTGFYAMLTGIAPIVLYCVLDMWRKDDLTWLKQKHNLLWLFSSAAVFGLGYILYNRLYVGFSRSDSLLNKSDLFIDNTLGYIKGLFLLFGALPSEEVKILSASGLSYLVRIVLVLSMIAAFIAELKKMRRSSDSAGVFAFIFLWNAFILFVSQTRISEDSLVHYRYMIVGSLPLLILLGKTVSDRFSSWPCRKEIGALAVLFLMLAAMQFGCSKNVLNYCRTQNTYLKEVIAYVDTLDVKSVIWLNDSEYFNKCRGVDDDHIWGCYIADEQQLFCGMNCYYDCLQGSYYDKDAPSAFISYSGTAPADCLPAEVAPHYTYAGSVEYFDIYVSDGVYFD